MVRSLRAFPVVLVAIVGCAAPQAPTASPTRAPELARPAETLTPTTEPVPAGTGDPALPSDGTSPTLTPDPATTPAPGATPRAAASPRPSSTSPSPTTSVATFRLVGAVDDPAGDQGLEGPDHADLRRVTLEDDGEHLRARVTVAGDVPPRPDEGEVIGIGIDLLDEGGESVYQLFADGGADGWFAYLQTPDGFVPYPGDFRLGGRIIEFVVPWNHLGSPARGPFSAFLDWSRERPIRNAAASDRAPDRGSGSFERT